MNPVQIVERLEQIDRDLAERQEALEQAAAQWVRAKREREQAAASALIAAKTEGVTIREAEARATVETALIGLEAEARFEALKRVVGVLEARASIGQTLVRTNVRLAA